jgi:radical SAM protein with 4Fe4S-binding SPASM domain
MRYVLSDNIALRSWELVPYAYYAREKKYAQGLTKAEFERLLLCDGEHELAEDGLMRTLLDKGLCHVCHEGDGLSEWQRHLSCRNRYFARLFWSITERCGYRCLHCYNAADETDGTAEFSWDECRDLVASAAACGIHRVKLTGGEPLAHPRFLDIVRDIHAHGMSVDRIYTTGELLTTETLDELRAIGSRPVFKVSFDGLGAHDWLHQVQGAGERTLASMRLAREAGFRVIAVLNANRRNAPRLLETARLLNGMGVDGLQITRTTESPRWKSLAPECSLSPEGYYDAMLELADGYLSSGDRMPIEMWSFLRLDPATVLDRRPAGEAGEDETAEFWDKRPVCRSNRSMVGVAATGELVPCLTMTGILRQRGISFGNVHDTPLAGLLSEGPYLEEACRTMERFRADNPACGACPHYVACLGGCPALALALSGDIRASDPTSCAFFKGGYAKRREDVLERHRG